MRIGLNLLHALPEIGGGWNYIANLLAALAECDDTNTYISFVTRASQCLVPAKSNFIPVCINISAVSRVQRVAYENTVLQLLLPRYRLDCLHWFANVQAPITPVPGVVTVYDLHAFIDPKDFPLHQRLYLQVMMYVTAKVATKLLPMSQATAQDLHSILNVNPARMVVIPVVMNSDFKPAAAEDVVRFRAKYGLPENFWLYVAHTYPHKNHLRLLQAYRELKSSDSTPWPLVLRGDPKGAEAEVMEAIVHLNLEGDVIILPRLDQAELPVLYSTAAALVFPSLYEGAGIPVVEAMACGCPVLASNIPPVKEFADDAAFYFDPLDIASIAETMAMFQTNPTDREVKRREGLARAAEFRPQPVISRLLSAYAGAAH